MKRSSIDVAGAVSGDAINLLLDAERRAREAVQRCEQAASEILNAARAEARRVNERADARISALHIRCDLEIAQRVAELRAAARQIQRGAALDHAITERLKAAGETVGRRLTGFEDG
jgi:cell division septum initiation protein DivIVA